MNYGTKQDNDNFLPRNIYFVRIRKELISKLENKELKNIDDFFYDIDYKFISNKNLSEIINTNTNVVTSNGDIILKNFRNKNKILDIENIYESYLNYFNENKKDENIFDSRLIYNNLNKEKLSVL